MPIWATEIQDNYMTTKSESYLELKARLDALALKAEAARTAELQSVIDGMRENITTYGITAEDLFPTKKRRGKGIAKTAAVAEAALKSPVPPKYRDPKTGNEWSGRGRAPQWIAGKNRDRFLIKTSA